MFAATVPPPVEWVMTLEVEQVPTELSAAVSVNDGIQLALALETEDRVDGVYAEGIRELRLAHANQTATSATAGLFRYLEHASAPPTDQWIFDVDLTADPLVLGTETFQLQSITADLQGTGDAFAGLALAGTPPTLDQFTTQNLVELVYHDASGQPLSVDCRIALIQRVFTDCRVDVRDPQYGAIGDGVTDDYPAFASALADLPDGGVLYVPCGHYFLSQTLELTKQILVEGATGSGWFATSVLHFPRGVTGIRIASGYPDPNVRGSWSVIRDLALMGTPDPTAATAHGIEVRSRCTIERVWIHRFSHNGIDIYGSALATVDQSNSNLWQVRNTVVDACLGDGLHVQGPDANAGSAISLSSASNGGWGVHDESFLGNTYVGCHTATNGLGSYRTTNPNARNVFLNCYAEQDQPQDIKHPAIAIGGTGLVPLDAQSSGTYLGAGRVSDQLEAVTSPGEPDESTLLIGGQGVPGAVLGFHAAADSQPYRVRFEQLETGWWAFSHANLNSRVPFSLSGTFASEGPGHVLFNRGYWLGDVGQRRQVTIQDGPPQAGTHRDGDIIYVTDPNPGGVIGYVCVLAGSPGKWKPFGKIAR